MSMVSSGRGAAQGEDSGGQVVPCPTQRKEPPAWGNREPLILNEQFPHLIPSLEMPLWSQARDWIYGFRFLPCGRWVIVCYFPVLQWVITGGCTPLGHQTVGVMKLCCCKEAPCWRRRAGAGGGLRLPASWGRRHGGGRCRTGCMAHRQLLWADRRGRARVAAAVAWE